MKQRQDLSNNIRYFNDIDFSIKDPTNIGQHVELSHVQNIYDNSERNSDLQNMNPNVIQPYCKPYYSDYEPNNFGHPVSLIHVGYYCTITHKNHYKYIENYRKLYKLCSLIIYIDV